MKRKIWISAGILITAGIILLIAGVVQGGIVYGVSITSHGLVINSNVSTDKQDKEVYREEKKELQPFTEVNLDLEYANLNVVESDHYGLEYRISNQYTVTSDVEDGKLHVVQADKNLGEDKFYLFSIGLGSNMISNQQEEYVTVYIPKGVALDSATLSEESGNIAIDNLSTKKLKVKNSYGRVEANQIQADQSDWDMESGKLSIQSLSGKEAKIRNSYGYVKGDKFLMSGSLSLNAESGNIEVLQMVAGSLEIDSSYGRLKSELLQANKAGVKMESGNMEVNLIKAEQLDIDSSYGRVELGIEGKISDYSSNLKCSYGKIKINGEEAGTTYQKTDSVNKKSIKIKTESGNILIQENAR